MNALVADLRHALRIYAATPLASAVALAVLALAMGGVSAFLSLYSDIALKAHPGFEQSRQLVTFVQSDGRGFAPLSPAMIERVDGEVTSVAAVGGVGTSNLLVEPAAERVPVEYVSHGFFAGIAPRLQLGRGFDDRDNAADAEPVVVISDAFWRQHFGRRPDVLGETVRITGRVQIASFTPGSVPEEPPEHTTEYRIIGVMAPELGSTLGGPDTALWLPFEQAGPRYIVDYPTLGNLTVLYGIARLAENGSVAAVEAELNGRYAADEGIELRTGHRFQAMAGIVPNPIQQRQTSRQVALFLGGALLLGLVAACNVSLFLLSRAPGRRRELGIRMAVGAPMRRLARQLATEAALLVVAATLLGLVVSAWLAALLQDLPFLAQVRWRDVTPLDWRVLALTGALMLLLTALVSLAPVLGLKRLGVAASSRHATARAGVAQHVAATTQIAIACVLSGIALGFGWYLAAMLTADPGYDTAGVHMVSLVQPDGPWGFSADADAVLVERERRRAALLALPGVEAVAFGTAVPGRTRSGFIGEYQLEDGTNEPVRFNIYSADAAYAHMLDIRVAYGGTVDDSHSGGMMVNETLARALWGRSDVSGESIPMGLMAGGSTDIVGVLADVAFGHPSDGVEPMAWLPALPISSYEPILIRSRLPTAELRSLLQGLVDDGRLEIEIADIERLDDLVASLTAADRARSALAGGSALLVVILAGFGFYGTQRYLVSAGRREYAIHASVGAGPRALGRLVLRRGFAMGAPGLLLGGVLALLLVAWLRDDFFPQAVSPGIVAVTVVAGTAALLLAAIASPARQARRTAPAPLLREE